MAGFDYVVVGSGSAGAVIARRLVDAGANVCLLEAGGEDANPAIHDPTRLMELQTSPDDWDYVTVPQPGCGGREMHIPRGKVFGGSSAINGMIYIRGHRLDSTPGRMPETTAGATRTSSPCSSAPRTSTGASPGTTAPAASSGSRARTSRIRCSRRRRRRTGGGDPVQSRLERGRAGRRRLLPVDGQGREAADPARRLPAPDLGQPEPHRAGPARTRAG